MGWILLILLVILLWPAIRGYLTYRAMRNRAQEIFLQQQQAQQEAERKARQQQQGKTFDKDNSEYVDFEEVIEHKQTSSTTSWQESHSGTADEQQVSDAEFEDIA